MSILSLLQQAQNGEGLANMAAQFGLDADKAGELAGMLAPALGSAAQQQAASGNLGDLLGNFKGEDQAALFEDPTAAASQSGQAQGAAFLEQLLGGQEAASALTGQAAEKAGLDLGTVQSFLPAMAAMLQGGLQKSLPDDTLDAMSGGGAGGGLMGMASSLLGGNSGGMDLSKLTDLLDADGDGSALDDIMGKFLK
ncbi:hypothetical protein PH7735_00465 [Shimia thalassica]|uniref:DUF937 domain-containing protein n=1 Tax=Shimia thalassica TaxID=1715693 RepID=A0A0P1IEL6_9RHOB|nr:DUF937 domain-containing protein [Shimia thalassica]CUJ85219.1 hypothetical protein PH7735_00465 [Shimia thalassica]